MKEQELELETVCYVLPRVSKAKPHPIAYHRHDFIWYPEGSMSLYDQVMYRPYVQSIVTESPWLIANYSQEDVRVWNNGEWTWPDNQTYGADISNILTDILGLPSMVPGTPLDSGRSMQKIVDKIIAERKKMKGL